MPKVSAKNGNGSHRHAVATSKYDANNKVLSQTYGAFADLRRELADTKNVVCEREELLRSFATCPDSQRSWLLLEDYFEKLSLTRKDFPATEWWPRMLAASGNTQLEELAFLFLRAKRSLPPELTTHANMDRFARAEAAEHEHKLVRELENWLFPPQTPHLDTPRATLRVLCLPQPDEDQPARFRLGVQFHLFRPRTGEKVRSLRDLIDLATRAAHEQELFPPADWEFIAWLTEITGKPVWIAVRSAERCRVPDSSVGIVGSGTNWTLARRIRSPEVESTTAPSIFDSSRSRVAAKLTSSEKPPSQIDWTRSL